MKSTAALTTVEGSDPRFAQYVGVDSRKAPWQPGPSGHRDDLSPAKQASFAPLALSSVADAVELVRTEFEEYLARMAPDDDDDVSLAGRWTEGLHRQDVELLAALPPADVAEAAREGLARAAERQGGVSPTPPASSR